LYAENEQVDPIRPSVTLGQLLLAFMQSSKISLQMRSFRSDYEADLVTLRASKL